MKFWEILSESKVGKAAMDYKRANRYPDGEAIPDSLPPRYQPANFPGVPANQKCSNCGYYESKSKKCDKFKGDPVVRPSYWCLKWEPKKETVQESIPLSSKLEWPEVVNKVSSAMKAMGWKSQRKDDGSFMFSTKGRMDDEWYFVIIDNEGEGFFTYALGTIEEGDPYIGEQDQLPNTEASVSELMDAIREGFGLDESVSEGSLEEKWSQKYKNSINCSNPKGFSQKAHCAGKKK